MEVHGPFLARKKLFRIDVHTVGSTSTFYSEVHSGWNDTTTSVDGFSIITGGTSFTGTVRVYGYANGA